MKYSILATSVPNCISSAFTLLLVVTQYLFSWERWGEGAVDDCLLKNAIKVAVKVCNVGR